MKLSYQVLVAIVECEDGEPSDDVEEWAMREFGDLADAERFAENVYGNNDGSSDLMGMGTPSTDSYPSCVQCGDSVQFVVPEPSALALLLTGTVGLLAYAWRQRRQWGA